MAKVKILFLAANPTDTSALRLDKECRDVGGRIRLAEHRNRVELVSRWAVRTDDVIQALLEEQPHVVHFSGHGETSGLILEDSQGQSRTVTPEALPRRLSSHPGISVVQSKKMQWSSRLAAGKAGRLPFITCFDTPTRFREPPSQ